MPPSLLPTTCLPFEADECHRLEWMPLAVRFKLDACALRLSLSQWQFLRLGDRGTLLSVPTVAEFRPLAVAAGASSLSAPMDRQDDFAAYVIQKRSAKKRKAPPSRDHVEVDAPRMPGLGEKDQRAATWPAA